MAQSSGNKDYMAPNTVDTANITTPLFPTNTNKQSRSITDIWLNSDGSSVAETVKECLSCDRWAGTTVMGGGAYLLWNVRRAPSTSSKLVMLFTGSLMVVGGTYQGWISQYFNVRIHIVLQLIPITIYDD